MSTNLDRIDDDVLICVFSFLTIPEILYMRQLSKRMNTISKLRIVWHNICTSQILRRGLPFSNLALDSMSISELENRTCHAYRLSKKWLTDTCEPRELFLFHATFCSSISDLRFIPGHDGKWLLTVSKSIWSVLCLWDISRGLQKCCEWSPRGAIFNGFTLNTDPTSEATLAVSVSQDGEHKIEILSLQQEGLDSTFKSISRINTAFKPTTIRGKLLAFSDHFTQTVIWNWKENTFATLQHPRDGEGIWQNDQCIQVVFAYKSIVVVRARSIHLFPEPILRSSEDSPLFYAPIARHSFGWIDGVAVILDPCLSHARSGEFISYPSLSILIRAESDDPWSSGSHSLDLYTLKPNPTFALLSSSDKEPVPEIGHTSNTDPNDVDITALTPPYLFPPVPSSRVQSVRGSLRCTDVILGRYGTAVWIQPQDRAVAGLILSDVHLQEPPPLLSPTSHESLIAAVFPGPLNSNTHDGSMIKPKTLWSNSSNDWTALDYDEELGRIALGSSSGQVTILEL